MQSHESVIDMQEGSRWICFLIMQTEMMGLEVVGEPDREIALGHSFLWRAVSVPDGKITEGSLDGDEAAARECFKQTICKIYADADRLAAIYVPRPTDYTENPMFGRF